MSTQPATFVAASRLFVPQAGVEPLEQAFRDRLGRVEAFDAFERLEVWRESGRPGHYTMVSWWHDENGFTDYLRSEDHRVSHARIPDQPVRSRPVGLSRFTVIAR